MDAEIDVGKVIAGKYELVRLIGKGAMGEVWLATHNTLGGEFAIKLVRPSEDSEDESAAGRFQLEAQISAKLSRKTRHIISVSDHGEEDGLAYLVMELLHGESLEARIERTGAFPLAETVAIVMQIARALGQAHAEQIFHRDLKPANVFLTKDEDGRLLVKLLDFGIARTAKPFRTRSPFMTGKDMVLGTPSYMSPEQARGLDTLDHRCDLWALGVVAYESLAKAIPWEGESVEDIFLSICTHRWIPILNRRGDLPLEVEQLFERSFAQKLDQRFRTAAELSEAFEVLVDPAEVEAAMGARPATASGRRLPAASNHDLSVHTPHTPRGTIPIPSQVQMQSGEPGSDPVGVAVGGPTQVNPKWKRSYSGWLVAAAAAMATIGIILLGLTFASRGKSTTKSPLTESTTQAPTPSSANIPPPEPAVLPTPVVVTPTPTTKPLAPTTKGAPPIAKDPAPTPPPPTPATTAPPVVVAPPPPAPRPPPPTPPASATAKKPLDKGEVF